MNNADQIHEMRERIREQQRISDNLDKTAFLNSLKIGDRIKYDKGDNQYILIKGIAEDAVVFEREDAGTGDEKLNKAMFIITYYSRIQEQRSLMF